MKARLTRGALVLDPPLLAWLGIDENGEVEISRGEGAFVLRPIVIGVAEGRVTKEDVAAFFERHAVSA